MTHKSSTETLISAMRILANDIQSDDGVANAAIWEAAERLKEQRNALTAIRDCKQSDVVKYIQTVDSIACDALSEDA